MAAGQLIMPGNHDFHVRSDHLKAGHLENGVNR